MAVRASDKVTLAVLASPTYVRLYYVLQASALAAPALPTANPPAAPWTATEPTYTAGSTNTLYTTLLTAYGSLTFGYGAVQVSSSYEAAKAAFNKAVAVESTANGKNAIVRSAAIPTNPPAAIYKASDLWWVFVGTQVTAMYVHDGTNWIAQSLTGATITNLDAGVITAGVITGRTLQTAIAGTRVVIDGAANTLKFFGPTSTIAAVITGSDDEGAAPTAITITTALESVRFGHTYLPVSGSVEMHAPSAWIEDLVATTIKDDLGNPLFIGGKIRLAGVGEVGVGATYADTAPFVIGTTAGLNMIMDTNELQARSLTDAASININSNGGNVNLGTSAAAGTVSIEGRAMTDSGWINCSLINSWTAVAGLTPQYRKLYGVMYLRGRATGGTTNNVFVLPSGYRSTYDLVCNVQNGSTVGAVTRIVIDNAGGVAALSGTQPNFEMTFLYN